MRVVSSDRVIESAAPRVRPQPPSWVADLPPAFTLLSTERLLPQSSAAELADAVASVYDDAAGTLARSGRHAVRIWNFVPDIQGRIDGAGDRYMAFNHGRYDAYCRWFGAPESFRRAVPTSSAVGVDGTMLSVHVLASEVEGEPVENPRQIPAYQYSRRYGPRPPCFARATRLGSRLLIGGTASILGERSTHDGDIERQTRETLQNIAALLGAAREDAPAAPLDRLSSLRVHVRDAADAPAVRAILAKTLQPATDIELVQASLCRKELLVEIEGVAEW